MSQRKTIVKFHDEDDDEEYYEEEQPKKPVKRKSASSKKTKGISLFKKILFAFMGLIILILSVIIYFMMNVNIKEYIPKLKEDIKISVDKIEVATETLRQKNAKSTIDIKIKNEFWLPVIVDNFKFSMNIGEYEIAKNMSAKINHKLDSNLEIKVPINVPVESITTRRALQKAVAKNATEVVRKLLQQSHIPNEAYQGDIKGVVSLTGIAEMKLNVLGINMPFTVEYNHN